MAEDSAEVWENREVFEKREQLLEAYAADGAGALPLLTAALDDDSALVRRTAAHLLVRIGESARGGYAKALANEDFQVRRIIIYGLAEQGLINEYWSTLLLDTHPSIRRELQLYFMQKYPIPEGEELDAVIAGLAAAYAGGNEETRLHVVEIVGSLAPGSPPARKVMLAAISDSHPGIRERAYRVILDQITPEWEEARMIVEKAENDEIVSIRELAFNLERKVLEVERISLPVRRWRFKTDPDRVGREQGWYAVNFNDSDWRRDARIGEHWGRFLDEAYTGEAWYRRTFDVPKVEGWKRILLRFNGADEQAWVWLNGEYVGEHAMGLKGWDIPFMFDVTGLIEVGKQNHLAVLVDNAKGNGGLWRSIELIFMRDWE